MVAKASLTAVDIIEWLAGDECHAYDGSRLIAALAAMLGECGLPVQRLAFHLRVPHPTLFGRSIAWAPDEPVTFLDLVHGAERSERIQKSPVLHVMSTRD
jgi:adenylate cyclase